MEIRTCSKFIFTDEKEIIIFDNQNSGVLIVTPAIINEKLGFETKEPKGIELKYWLEKFGLVSETELLELEKNAKLDDKRKLYERLHQEFNPKSRKDDSI